MSDINNKLDNILSLLSNNNIKLEKEIKNIDDKLESSINVINNRLDILEKKYESQNNKNSNLIYQIKEESLEKKKNDEIIINKNINEKDVLDNKKNLAKDLKSNLSNKKRGKYLKTNEKSEFLKNIHYLQIKEGKKFWKYSLSTYNGNSKSGYYYCSDTHCRGKGTCIFNMENISEYEKKINNKEIFNITKDHTISYENHNYIISLTLKNDFNNYNIDDLKKKLSNIKYIQNFLKLYVIKNNEIISSVAKLYNIFNDEFGEIKLNYNSLTNEEKNLLISRYKKRKKISEKDNVNLDEILNIKSIINGAYTYLRNYREYNREMFNNLINLTFNNEKIISEIFVNYERKNKLYKKEIYIIMTKDMITNIINKDNIQYFMDVTYYATPPNTSKYKLLVILAFNRDLYKSIICNLSILQNENKETFVTILEYLKNKYNWIPTTITFDYSKAEKNALQYVFPNIKFIPCFYHFMVNIIKHLPELKSKNKTIKTLAKDCLANIKLLSFIPLNYFDSFYKLIYNKYQVKFPKFFIYFKKNYINGKIFDKSIWNYTNVINNNINNDIIFFTNNIVESFNSIINKKLVGFCKTMLNYKRALLEVLSIYQMKTQYIEKKISITRALEHYIKTQNYFDLISYSDIKKIKKNRLYKIFKR